MTFYIVSFVGKVGPDGKPLRDDAPALPTDEKAIRELPFWDARPLEQLMAAYMSDGALTLMRVGEQHSKGRPWEERGEMTFLAPWLVTVHADAKMNHKQPSGPVPYQPREVPRL